jgi:hypothetical protein
MKITLFALLLIVLLTGCSSAKVFVNTEKCSAVGAHLLSCEEDGIIK